MASRTPTESLSGEPDAELVMCGREPVFRHEHGLPGVSGGSAKGMSERFRIILPASERGLLARFGWDRPVWAEDSATVRLHIDEIIVLRGVPEWRAS